MQTQIHKEDEPYKKMVLTDLEEMSLNLHLGVYTIPERWYRPRFIPENVKPVQIRSKDHYAYLGDTKNCATCNREIKRTYQSGRQWAAASFCSAACSRKRGDAKVTTPKLNSLPVTTVRTTKTQRIDIYKNVLVLVEAGMTNLKKIYKKLSESGQIPSKDGVFMSENSVKKYLIKARQEIGNKRPKYKSDKVIDLLKHNVPTITIMQKLNCKRSYVSLVANRHGITITELRNDARN